MSQSKKRNIIIGSLCAVVLLMAVGYAAFQTVLNIQGTSNITSSWNVKITKVESKNIVGTASNNGDPSFEELSATFKTSLQTPGDSIEYDITVTNAGSLDAKLDEITLSDTNNPAIKFTASGMTKGDVITAGNTKVLTVKVEYLSSVSEQPTNTTSSLTVDLDYSQAISNTPSGETAADKLIGTVVTTGDGLYADTYEEGRYIYRGGTPNNYITFNNEEWRIVSVETDNTLKIIKEERLPEVMSFDASNSRTASYCNYAEAGCNVWGSKTTMLNGSGSNVTQMAINLKFSTNKYDLPTSEATLNTYLNTTYYASLSNTAKNQISVHQFNVGVLMGYDDASETLAANISQEKANTWNGKVGLIEATDFIKSSTNGKCTNIYNGSYQNNTYPCKNNNYLYKSDYHWWTLSPYSDETSHFVWNVVSDGYLNHSYARDAYNTSADINGVRPVLHLKSDITLSGEGTQSNPYTIG